MLHANSCSIQLEMTSLWGIWVGSPVNWKLNDYLLSQSDILAEDIDHRGVGDVGGTHNTIDILH